ncbi:phosphatase [Bifidobacterium aemilianum]|uniref:Phosphatase n=1 Tax=Bifidobacterium aemilianum TaxID=2493120 RepID=A0A366KA22_9BIFI|nr:PHP domain-containing protein [Bifidobacterium aemilianum]RBP98595.1 phosphatase [Bifidobacterium aemilianum]
MSKPDYGIGGQGDEEKPGACGKDQVLPEAPGSQGQVASRQLADERTPASGWDLHCHTAFSDGTRSPSDLVEEAKALGLHGVAITDHDTNSGWDLATVRARELGLPLLRGTEITADDQGVSVHLLAYQYDPRNSAINELFFRTRRWRLDRAKAMVGRLAEDFPIDWQAVLDQVREGERTTIGRPHMADALVAAGAYPNRSAAFSGAISSRSKYYVPTKSPSASQAIRAVKEAGGVAVIAHPGDRSRNRRLLSDQRIMALAGEDGLDGLEVWHRGNLPDQRRRLLVLADSLGLLVTGGSDWHGAGKPNRIGEHLTDDGTVTEMVGRGTIPLA